MRGSLEIAAVDGRARYASFVSGEISAVSTSIKAKIFRLANAFESELRQHQECLAEEKKTNTRKDFDFQSNVAESGRHKLGIASRDLGSFLS